MSDGGRAGDFSESRRDGCDAVHSPELPYVRITRGKQS